jgi:hypothetical protein
MGKATKGTELRLAEILQAIERVRERRYHPPANPRALRGRGQKVWALGLWRDVFKSRQGVTAPKEIAYGESVLDLIRSEKSAKGAEKIARANAEGASSGTRRKWARAIERKRQAEQEAA